MPKPSKTSAGDNNVITRVRLRQQPIGRAVKNYAVLTCAYHTGSRTMEFSVNLIADPGNDEVKIV